MTSEKRVVPYLRLVSPNELVSVVSGKTADFQQTSLFPTGTDRLLVFAPPSALSGHGLNRLLDAVTPNAIVDLRLLPRFDFGNLNRRTALKEFEKRRITYWDMSPSLAKQVGPSEYTDAASTFTQIESRLDNSALRSGPILVFVPDEAIATGLPYELARMWPGGATGGWDLCILPNAGEKQPRQSVTKESLLFISHANPEDNEFVIWLTANLQRLGYKTWVDVGSLQTGDVFWDRIEDVIRNQAAKVIAVISKASQRKPGVLDEINLALTVERMKGVPNFVLPIKLDDLSYSDVRANLARKNVTNFANSWAAGFQSLVATLEAEKIDREPGIGQQQLLDTWKSARRINAVIQQSERLTSNWLPIISLPPTVYIYEATSAHDGEEPAITAFADLMGSYKCSFAALGELPRCQYSLRAEIATPDFLRGNQGGFIRIPQSAARNAISSLTRIHWDEQCLSRGMLPYQLSGRRRAWYFPFNDENQLASYVDSDGHRYRRALCGQSEKRKVYWHFALEGRIALSDPPRIAVLEHVVFTADGFTPLPSKQQAHRLRRSFCKNWWNDRWRDLLTIGLARVFDSSARSASLGRAGPTVQTSPIFFESPVSINESANDEAEFAEVDLGDVIEDLEMLEDWEDAPPNDSLEEVGETSAN